MKIAFYAPLKSPGHPVPSGDRLVARLALQALERAGHAVTLVSEFRSFSRTPEGHASIRQQAEAEARRIRLQWEEAGSPDLWFTYHVYYKAPDFLGPALAAESGIPYVTMEASWSRRRNDSGWAAAQETVLAAVRQAAFNICLTARDEAGLLTGDPKARTVRLKPFLDAEAFLSIRPMPEPGRLITVAMMRPGDKMESYRALAETLALIAEPFTLDVIGDGPCRDEVEALLGAAAPGRVRFHGELPRSGIADLLSRAAVYLWPGVGEAYGMAYLEAAAAGLPVVAFDTGGVNEVVFTDETGLLVAAGDTVALATAIRRLLLDERERTRLAGGARAMVIRERGMDHAAARLDEWLSRAVKGYGDRL